MELSTDVGGLAPSEISTGQHARLSSVWATRRARALQLAIEVPDAEELLCTYAELLDVQARVAEAVPVRLWLALVSAEAGPPRLRLDRLPVDELVPLFADFLAAASGLGTDVMQLDAGALSGAPGASWLTLIGAALTRHASQDDPPFHVRAFLQPVATTLAVAEGETIETAKGGRCLVCGAAPAVGVIQHLRANPESRSLQCAVCGNSWRLPRLACARCGEDDTTRLPMHGLEAFPWVRVDACVTCGHYMKTVDMRLHADAVPLVDDLATLELDAWAREQGLTRVHDHLFGSSIA